MTTQRCGKCGGDGWVVGTESAHDPNCDGSCVNCPVPVPVQIKCERCDGTGREPTE